MIKLSPGTVFELTGVSASGKTAILAILDKNNKNIRIFNSGLTKSPDVKIRMAGRIFNEIKNLYNLFFYGKDLLDFRKIKWLLLTAFKVEATYLFRINIFLNCILKFSYHATLRRYTSDTIVFIIDEGVSHIPFLLQDQNECNQMIEEYFIRFGELLSKINVLYLDGDGVNTVERLMNRGHKRLKNRNIGDARVFDKKNRETISLIIDGSEVFKSFEKIN
jgi:hypothetical protein